MLIAGNTRDEFIVQGNEDGKHYREEVEKKIKDWIENHSNKKEAD